MEHLSSELYQPDEPIRRRNLWNIAYPVGVSAGGLLMPLWSTYYFAKNDPGDLREMAITGAVAGIIAVGSVHLMWRASTKARQHRARANR